MKQLSEFQLGVLTKLGQGKLDVFGCMAGKRTDPKEAEITEQFNDICRLVEWGLVSDISDAPRVLNLVKQAYEEDGREMIVVKPNRVVMLMFKKVRHNKWLN